MSQINVIARFSIHEGQLEAFKAAAAECQRIVTEKDQNTLQYDWSLNSEQTECVVVERYRDSDAVLEHVSHVGETLGVLAGVSDMSLEVLGDVSDELAEATAPLAPRVYVPL